MSEKKGKLNVIYDDNHVLGLVKPSGVLSQGDNTGDDSILDIGKEYIREKYKKPGNIFLGCVHRLDRVSSGVMVYAKTSKALQRLNKEFAERRALKRYMVVVEGENIPKMEEELTHYLKKDESTNTVKAYRKEKTGAKKAVLRYKMLGEINGMFLLDIDLETGRPHQIRAQMAQAGFPVVGDVKYGSKSGLPKREIALHCYELKIKHPTQESIIHLKHAPTNNEPWRKFSELITYVIKGK